MPNDFRCAPWTAAQGFDPIGSATRFDRLVTVEVPHPWPARIEEVGWLADLPEVDGTRVQGIVPESDRADGTVLLTRWERTGAVLAGVDWRVPAPDVPTALEVLVAGTDLGPADVAEAPPEVLICGHGQRDRCCGGAGTRLAVQTRAALPELRVRRTSHLGGHRYAPTALTLPDGRLWAHLDPGALVGIIDRTLPPAEARGLYRGNSGLDPWNQTLEGELLAESGWDGVAFTELSGSSLVDGDRAHAHLRWSSATASGERTATVEVVRRYPVISCGLPPDQAEKDTPEYAIVS